MAKRCKSFSYQSLARDVASIRGLVGAERWEEAAHSMDTVAVQLESLPAACAADRVAIEKALTDLAELAGRVQPLHADMAHMLATSGPEPGPSAAV